MNHVGINIRDLTEHMVKGRTEFISFIIDIKNDSELELKMSKILTVLNYNLFCPLYQHTGNIKTGVS